MKIDIYSIAWNEWDMVDFFFRNYDQVANRYIIFDDGSTDSTVEHLAANPKVEIRPFPRNIPNSFVLSAQFLHNTAWKESRDTADWVIISAIDEHLIHQNFSDYLRKCLNSGITAIPALGFQMVSETFPRLGTKLFEEIPFGAPFTNMNKLCLFQPSQIEETNYSIGRHSAEPTGNVVLPEIDELLNLHFKYLDFERLCTRHKMLASGLGPDDIREGWGHRYFFDERRLRRDFDMFKKNAIDLRKPELVAAAHEGLPKWWRTPLNQYPSIAVRD